MLGYRAYNPVDFEGFRDYSLGLGFWASEPRCLGFRVQGLGLRV